MHAQFEMIHPFKDGNGRVGRLLIPMLLFYKKVLPYPIFYISRYFAENNDYYKERLANISKAKTTDGKIIAWKSWIDFFFDGVAQESIRHIDTSKKINAVHKDMTAIVNKTEMISLIDMLFDRLKLQPKEAIDELHLPPTSVRKELQHLADNGYLTRTGSPRKTVYVFTKLIGIVEK